MSEKRAWKVRELEVAVYWPGARIVELRGYLERDADRRIEAHLTLAQARELRDALSVYVDRDGPVEPSPLTDLT